MGQAKANPFSIRDAAAGDEPSLEWLLTCAERLHARLAPALFQAEQTSDDRNRAIGAVRLGGMGELWLVAEKQRRIIGMLHAEIHAPPKKPWIAPVVRCQIHELVVAPRHRRRGVGRALMSAAAVWARRQGAVQMLLTVWTGNRAAHRFYEGLGFRSVSAAMMCPL